MNEWALNPSPAGIKTPPSAPWILKPSKNGLAQFSSIDIASIILAENNFHEKDVKKKNASKNAASKRRPSVAGFFCFCL